jgi:hypothetical protein
MSLISVVLNVIPQIQVGAEKVTEVACRLLHFLVVTALSATTATVVCSTLASMTCATPALLVAFAPLISTMLTSLVSIASSTLISRTVHLIVHVPVARNLVVDDFGWWMLMERVYASC